MTSVVASLQPRHLSSAVRSVVTLSLVAAAVTVLFAPIQTGGRELSTDALLIMLACVAGVLLIGTLVRGNARAMTVVWAVGPFLAVGAILTMDLLTADASTAALVFFIFPALYGASQLRPAGAMALTVASLAGAAIVVVTLLPVREALVDIGYLGAALVATSVLLTRSAERQEELVARLERQAAIDPLTGLVTRRVLDEAAQSAMSGAASGAGTSLILLDVDNFKSINDRFGHPGGDQVLVELAQILNRSARSTDVTSRMGGDEIALLLPGCSIDDLRRRAHEIVEHVRSHVFEIEGHEAVSVSVSVGMAHAPSQAVDLRSLYATADQALYEAKRSGRDRVGFLPVP